MVVPADSPVGRAYLHDQQWCRSYAAANRRAIASAIIALLRDAFAVAADESRTIHCDHNHVAAEVHGGRPVWVHRKGAMPAAAGVAGVVPGSMGTRTAHVVGRGCPASLDSTAHGAGRLYSRAAARDRFTRADVRQQLRDVWFDPRRTDALREELPKAYKDVRAVLAAQTELIGRDADAAAAAGVQGVVRSSGRSSHTKTRRGVGSHQVASVPADLRAFV